MNRSLVASLLADRTEPTRLLYGTATGPNTVMVAGSEVAVELPALEPVADGQYVAVLAQGADRLILGAMSTPWVTVSTYANGWGAASTPVEYRRVGDMVNLRGDMSSGTLNTVAFTLPTGFRPGVFEVRLFESFGSAATAYIDTNGDVTPVNGVNTVQRMNGATFSVLP